LSGYDEEHVIVMCTICSVVVATEYSPTEVAYTVSLPPWQVSDPETYLYSTVEGQLGWRFSICNGRHC
jgi:hypothetical protein